MTTDSHVSIALSDRPGEQLQDGRRDFAFANPTGVCRRRADSVAEVAARAWGLMLLRTAMTALRTSSRPIASRALSTLVKAGELRRMRIVGTNEHVWGTTALLANQFPHTRPGTRFFRPKGGELWRPPGEFVHNQLALRVLCGLAEPSEFLTEPELARVERGAGYVADGVVRLTIDDATWVLALEVEKSRKTGTKGGWSKLAKRIVAICLETSFGRWTTPLGIVNGVLLVSSIGDARAILAHVRENIHKVEDEDAHPVWFLFVEIRGEDGTSIRRYSDVHPLSPLGPVQVWRAESDNPDARAVATVWTPL